MTPLPLYAIAGNPEIALVLIQHQLNLPAQLVLSPNFRLSGLLRVMPPELLQVFIALLTFQEAMGEVRANVEQLAEVFELHPDLVEQRLQTLAAYTFDDAPIIFLSAERTYSLSKRVGVPVDLTPPSRPEPTYRTVPREVLIERSRRLYAKPRAEVEAIIEAQLARIPPEPIPEGRPGDAYRALLAAGVPEDQARQLIKESPLEEIEVQLAWLPKRGARNPGRFLVAAIRGSYAPPPGHEIQVPGPEVAAEVVAIESKGDE